MANANELTGAFKGRVYQYVLKLIRFLAKIPNDPVLSEMKRQLTKSGASVGANYFEAISGSSKRDFLNFFNHSLKSANESKFWLALIRDSGFANIFASSILTLKGKRTRSA